MTRDPLDLLRTADPVPQPVDYPQDDVVRRIADILACDGQLPASIDDAPSRLGSGRHWLPAGLVAAAVLVLAVVSAVVFTRSNSDKTPAGASPVTCAVSITGGSKAVEARLRQAESAITERVRGSGGSAHDFVTDPVDGSVGFTPHGVSLRIAGRACQASTVAIRPVVAPGVRVDASSPRTDHPLAGLRFAIPSNDAAYARLTAAQRSSLATAMSRFDCTPPPSLTRFEMACSTVPGSTQVLLLGSALVTGPDIRGASAVGPSTGAGGSNVAWTVALSFRAAGATRFHAFTGAHHTSNSSAAVSDCGRAGAVPCGDFLAITANGRILSVPVTNAVLDHEVSISGAFDESLAQTLAGEVTAASVQLHPR